MGSKAHLTETCADDAPNLITHAETTSAPTSGDEVTPRVHRALEERHLLPQGHLVDPKAQTRRCGSGGSGKRPLGPVEGTARAHEAAKPAVLRRR